MGPNPNNANQPIGSTITNNEHNIEIPQRPRPITDNVLQRSVSDISHITFVLNDNEAVEEPTTLLHLPPILEVESAKCECCGMCEECTKEYIKSVRDMFYGRLVCGLCASAVNEEMEKNGAKREEALEEHVRVCVKFNKLGRSYLVLYQAEAMKEILRKTSRSKSNRDRKSIDGDYNKAGISRSSSCIASITREKVGDTIIR